MLVAALPRLRSLATATTETVRRPRIAVIVANAITGDSRVQKLSLSAAQAGWDVLLIGRSRTGRTQRTWMGPVKVLRVPVETHLERQEDQRRRDALRRRLLRVGMPTEVDVERASAQQEARARGFEEKYCFLFGF